MTGPCVSVEWVSVIIFVVGEFGMEVVVSLSGGTLTIPTDLKVGSRTDGESSPPVQWTTDPIYRSRGREKSDEDAGRR